MDDARLLAHYLAGAGEPWNVSPEAAYLDYLLRSWPQVLVRAAR